MECLRGLARLAGAYIAKQGIPFLSLIIPVGKLRWQDFGPLEPLRISASAIVDKMLLGACALLAIVQVAQLATGLGVIAAHQGCRVRFDTAAGWSTQLTQAHNTGELDGLLKSSTATSC